jgi:hypothetical protein
LNVPEPAGHAVQFKSSCERKKPAAHATHDRGWKSSGAEAIAPVLGGGGDTHCMALVEPTGPVLPSGQAVQDIDSMLLANFPAAHSVHLEAAVVAENVPAGHESQKDA